MIARVIKYYFQKDYSGALKDRVQQWLLEEEYKEEKQKVLFELWEGYETKVNKEVVESLAEVKNRLGLEHKQKSTLFFPFRKLRVAAVLFMTLLMTGGIFYFYLSKDATRHTVDLMVYTARKGETKIVDWPDGSKVWLNAGSTLTCKKKKEKDPRRFKLSGEANFVVIPDSLRPFIVETTHFTVEVLGTEFHIEDYPEDSRAIIRLYTGRIRVEAPDEYSGTKSYVLEPDQILTYDSLTGVHISQIYPDEKKDEGEDCIIFENLPFRDVIHTLERHFNVRIMIRNFQKDSKSWTGKFKKEDGLIKIMDLLQKVEGDFTYEIIDRSDF